MHPTFRPDIEGLRAVAVLMVVLYHVGFGFSGGFAGVDVFFVISGYLITGNILRDLRADSFTFRGFIVRRLRRIYPAMLTTVAVTVVVGAVILAPGALTSLGWEAIWATTSLSNVHYWLGSGYFDTESSTKPLLHTWSLGVEEQFYLVWPALMVAAFGLFRRHILMVIAAVAVISFAASVVMLNLDPSGAFFLLPARGFEFCIGAALAAMPHDRHPSPVLGSALVGAGLIGLLVSAVLFNEGMPFPSYGALLPCLSAALCIFGGRSVIGGVVLSNAVLRYIGRISYSLYLVHWPIVVFAQYLLLRELTPWEGVAALVACLVAAHLLFTFIEAPFRARGPGGYMITFPRLASILAIVSCSILFISASTASGGWAWRLAPDRRALLAEISDGADMHSTYYGGRGCALPRCETRPNEGLPVVFVLGDSHARGLHAGLETIKSVNFVIYGPNSCPMYSTTERAEINEHAAACKVAQDMAFAEIAAADEPAVIIMQLWSNRWYQRYEGTDLYPFKTIKAFASYVGKEAKEFKQSLGIGSLLMIGGVPKYHGPLSPIDCLTRPLPAPDGCDVAKRGDKDVELHETFNLALASSLKAGALYDPYSRLCDKKVCHNFTVDGMPIYSDTSHLSCWGAMEIATDPAFLALVDDLAGSSL